MVNRCVMPARSLGSFLRSYTCSFLSFQNASEVLAEFLQPLLNLDGEKRFFEANDSRQVFDGFKKILDINGYLLCVFLVDFQ